MVRKTENERIGKKRGGGSGVTEVRISSSQGQISLAVTMETGTHSVDACWVSLSGVVFLGRGWGMNACVGLRRICNLSTLCYNAEVRRFV